MLLSTCHSVEVVKINVIDIQKFNLGELRSLRFACLCGKVKGGVV